MTERPTFVQIGFLPFEIQWIDDADWPKEDNEDGGLMEGSQALIKIRVNEDTHENNLREVLLHELMHAIFFVTQLTNLNWKEVDANDLEEEVIRITTPMILMVLRYNEEVFEYLVNA